LDFDMAEDFELIGFTFDGNTRKAGQQDNDVGWGAALEASLLEGRLLAGLGYISNLAESEHEILREQNNIFQRKVDAWSLYGVYEAPSWDFSIEMVRAEARFRELDPEEDKPSSWNIEAAWYPRPDFELAFRVERSTELLESPESRYGIAATWRIGRQLSITGEFMRAKYQKQFVEFENGVYLRNANIFAMWLAFEF
ncbi:MAG: hypothetical protein RL120_12370, partial [Gammaproteobacteria bacterium]